MQTSKFSLVVWSFKFPETITVGYLPKSFVDFITLILFTNLTKTSSRKVALKKKIIQLQSCTQGKNNSIVAIT